MERELTDEDTLGGGSYVKADDLAQTGKEVVTVVKVTSNVFPGKNGEKDQEKDVLHFADGRKLTLNATRRLQMKELFGEPANVAADARKIKVSAVKGKQITLVPAKAMFGGKKVNSIEVAAVDGKAPF